MIVRTPKKEVHKRIDPEDVVVTDYKPLVNKIVSSFSRCYGPIVTDHKDDFYSVANIGLMKARKSYDNTRGTFVTHAYRCITSEVLKLFKELTVEYATSVKVSASPDHDEDESFDRVAGSIFDYDKIGLMLSGTNKKLYWCLFNGMNYHKTLAMCDLNKKTYNCAISNLRAEIIEIMNSAFGGQI